VTICVGGRRATYLSAGGFHRSDLQDRADQWSRQGKCPPGLEPDTFAYRFGGCGTHENVVYYYMVRHLLWSCRDRLAGWKAAGQLQQLIADDFLAAELPRLARVRELWFDSPDPNATAARWARSSTASGGESPRPFRPRDNRGSRLSALPDDGRDLGSGPAFWHLDGCNLDDDFASRGTTRASSGKRNSGNSRNAAGCVTSAERSASAGVGDAGAHRLGIDDLPF